MPDVYVEAGTVKNVPNNYLTSAQSAMKAAVAAAANKTGSGMTTAKPPGGKGIQVNVLVTKLAHDGSDVTCGLIAELYEIPAKQRFTAGGSARGEGRVSGKIDAVAGACVGAAVTDLMAKIGPAIAKSQAPVAATGTAASKSPLIYIAPFQIAYAKDPNAAPAALASKTNAGITAMMDKKIKANTKRFTQDAKAFQSVSGMPAYIIGITVVKVTYNAAAKELVASVQGYVAEHPSGNIIAPIPPNSAKTGMSKPPTDADQVSLMVDAADDATRTAIDWILKKHP
jgi:hypothetical protein